MFDVNNRHLHYASVDPVQISYQQQIDNNEEKFRVWGAKSFFERKRAFEKIVMFDGFNTDSLSALIVEEMDLLLTRSEMSLS